MYYALLCDVIQGSPNLLLEQGLLNWMASIITAKAVIDSPSKSIRDHNYMCEGGEGPRLLRRELGKKED